MKKALIFILVLTLLFLTACHPTDGSSDASDGTGEPTERYFNQTDTTPEGWCVADGNYSNTYSGAPDIPPAGTVKLTDLAAFVANTASEGEDICFIVGVTAGDTRTSYTEEDFLAYEYNGKKVSDYLAEFEYSKYLSDNSLSEDASWNLLLDALNSGKSPEDALKDEAYTAVSTKYFEYKAAYYKALAAYMSEKVVTEEKPASAEYLASLGIELLRAPNTEDWQHHLAIVKDSSSRISMINGRMDYLVKCTAEELWELVDKNTDYGFIFYASDSAGRFILSNKAPEEGFRGNVASDLCFYDRTLIDSHVLFSFDELE